VVKDRPAIIAPPPLLAVVCIAAGFIADHYRPLPLIHGVAWLRIALSVALFLLGAAIIFSSRQELVRHHEHPNPYKPTNAIVTSGVYRFTRNPIYVAFLIVVIAVAIAANSAWLLLSFVATFVLLQFGVIRAEERYLAAKFGESYDEYRRRVRRWI
jgi:protein-S-isoprenylcysteine O-methyltransferase Ste14